MLVMPGLTAILSLYFWQSVELLSIISDMHAVHMLIAIESACTILPVLSNDMNECTRRTSKHENQTAQRRIVLTRYLSNRVNVCCTASHFWGACGADLAPLASGEGKHTLCH